MKRIVWNNEFEVWFHRLDRPYHFASPFGGEEFALLLVNNDSSITPGERETLANELVRHGCRYALCAGLDAAQWDDAIAVAYVCVEDDVESPEEHYVMTSSFVDERMADVVPHFRKLATFDNFDSCKYLVVFTGAHDPLEKETVELIVEAFAL